MGELRQFWSELSDTYWHYKSLIGGLILLIYFNRKSISRGLDILTGKRPWPKKPKPPE